VCRRTSRVALCSKTSSSFPITLFAFPIIRTTTSCESTFGSTRRLTIFTLSFSKSPFAGINGLSTRRFPTLHRLLSAWTASTSEDAMSGEEVEDVRVIQDMSPAGEPRELPLPRFRAGLHRDGSAIDSSSTLPILSNGGK